MKSLLLTILLATFASLPAFGVEKSVKPYPLDKCIVSDEKLGVEGKPIVFIYEGQEIKLCCKDCRKDFDANPAKFLAKLPKADAAPKVDKVEPAKSSETAADVPAKDTAVKPYPLKNCIVSDNDLDSMGEQASFVYQGQTIKVCCKPCIAKFEKNPAKYLKKLEGK
ncbi:MAG: hypothetical protein D4R66_05190 [Opitutales bacterium]|nr:MAG: hypothetical protein D4R66_05190 [Opitutales bacterium]